MRNTTNTPAEGHPHSRPPPAAVCPFVRGLREYFCDMNLYEAIQEMRRLSKEGIPIAFSFMSCDLTAGKSHGVVEVRHGLLRKRAHSKAHKHSEYTLDYYDLDTCEDRRFYQPLLMTFNNQRVTLQ